MNREFKRKTINAYSGSIAESFSSQLRSKRLELNMTVPALSASSGVSIRWIQFIENSQRLPSLYTIASLSLALDFYEWEFFSLKRL